MHDSCLLSTVPHPAMLYVDVNNIGLKVVKGDDDYRWTEESAKRFNV
jgi:hypothetical protein